MIIKNKLRLILALLALLALSIIGFFVMEKSRGKKRLEKARAAYIADGGSFERTSRFALPVPDAENFGAIPLLNGITAKTPVGDLIREKLAEIGLKRSGHSWPRYIPHTPRKHGHELRSRRDLTTVETYFIDIGLLTAAGDPTELATTLFDAYEAVHGADLVELHKGSARPSAVFLPLEADSYDPSIPMFKISYEELSTVQNLVKGLMLHAHLALRTDRADIALADIRTMNQLAIATQADGRSLIGHLVGIAITSMLLEPTWEGITDHRWTEAQLKELQSILLERDVAEEMREAFRSEVVFLDETYNKLLPEELASAVGLNKALTPLMIPFLDLNHAVALEFYHQDLLKPSMLPDGYSEAMDRAEATTSKMTSTNNPRLFLARLVIPLMENVIGKAAKAHSELHMAAAACALERYFLANQSYPEKLEELVPDFADQIPTDPSDGKPIRYEKTTSGRYRLYTIGADGDDNWGGEGDITWNYKIAPPPPPEPKKSRRKRKRKSP